ncbi:MULTISPECIES: hypothetical protein [unclassified Sphingomonas]|uniref:hypothetical protein n=1 Tax=unclassified Sphingomonas TaxID=196159 RepID=UPI001AC83508|nr:MULTISPECIES: hypothetical protein [unclassified Sphingomonas]MBN8849946.1 hypothetical protein [Sphingomonas sp.]
MDYHPDVCFDENGTWSPNRSGGYAKNCARGRDIADSLIAIIQENGFTPQLGHTMHAIAEAGVFEGVEIGFCSRIAERLYAAPR